MLTLKELKEMVNLTENNGRVPTAKQLIESGEQIVVKEVLAKESTISVYANGFVLYRAGKHYTVFSISDCGNYEYESVKGASKKYGSSFFDNENWYWLLCCHVGIAEYFKKAADKKTAYVLSGS